MTDAPDPRDASPDDGKVRRVPPLAWIILALLVLMVAIGVWQYGGYRTTPSGAVVPQDKGEASQAVMPAPEAAAAAEPMAPSGPAPSTIAPGDPSAPTPSPADITPPTQTPAD